MLTSMALAALLSSGGWTGVWAQSLANPSRESGCTPSSGAVIVKKVEPVTVRGDFSLDEIAEHAERSGQTSNHRPLGFYIGSVVYKITWLERPAIDGCPATPQVVALVSLVGRRIEIGRELERNPCLYRRAIGHYSRHATADEATFEKFAADLEDVLAQRFALLDSRNANAGQKPPIEESMRLTVEAALAPLGRQRAASQDSVDTPQEIEKLQATTCDHGGS
jgi:hypothetical protein